ncbi:MAG TPA: chemotaxis response regulator protein-glutamate methylesterase [Steroidobacteraceae bacterium]|nr:chemotaxis response regulator protein-glutamate methylesterase [Steroidobacteraceae bacterium]
MSERAKAARTRVLVIDDSAYAREIITQIMRADPDIEVVGCASDAHVAREMIRRLDPDVLTLDVEMPRMDGLTFLRNLMRLRPMPVVMVSSLTERGAEVTLEALAVGAIDFLPKPHLDLGVTLHHYADELRSKVKAAARAGVRAAAAGASHRAAPGSVASAPLKAVRQPAAISTTDIIVTIGASTGGTEAIRELLGGLPADAPGTVIAQHIPKAFSAAFAKRLNDSSALRVQEATDGQEIRQGHVYVAPGDRHLRIERYGTRYLCRLDHGPAVNHHRPSVDLLFGSVAQAAGARSIGVLLTGMGRDGAQGLLQLRNAGGHTIAQDEASSVIWGMPGEAVALGAAQLVLPLPAMAARLMTLVAAMDITRASRSA